ncbi:MAG: hypothetical protein E7311_06390 [Clostridiales bacterium]|nr:hypothetical protein [Clostridiales bacterium]
MMMMNILYKDYNIMRVLYKDNIFYTNISFENITKAKKEGFLVGNIADTKIMSNKCPEFILNRINIDSNNIEDIKKEILKNDAKLQTDKISIKILESN